MLCQSLYLPIQSVEVGLRNRINIALIEKFGSDWWQEYAFQSIAEEQQMQNIEQAQRRINAIGKDVQTDQIVATLTFGFWVSMLKARYNPPLWGQYLRKSFPHLPVGEKQKVTS